MSKIKLLGKYKIETTMELLSGLHIGDSKETTEIGGIDSPVVRRKDNREPYIPGSSIKGKIRCLLEQVRGISVVGDCEEINKIFGIAKKDNTLSSRLIFRDAYMVKDEIYDRLKSGEFTDMPFTEMKVENTIDRIKGKAKDGGIRNIERIPAGAKFLIEIIMNIVDDAWDENKPESDMNKMLEDRKEEISAMLEEGMKLLNNDYLGGSGSRGYGHVKVNLPVKITLTLHGMKNQ
jgi:CRISPR-associated protein Csm3